MEGPHPVRPEGSEVGRVRSETGGGAATGSGGCRVSLYPAGRIRAWVGGGLIRRQMDHARSEMNFPGFANAITGSWGWSGGGIPLPDCAKSGPSPSSPSHRPPHPSRQRLAMGPADTILGTPPRPRPVRPGQPRTSSRTLLSRQTADAETAAPPPPPPPPRPRWWAETRGETNGVAPGTDTIVSSWRQNPCSWYRRRIQCVHRTWPRNAVPEPKAGADPRTTHATW